MAKNDEMNSLVSGMIFLQDEVKNECFTFTEAEGQKYQDDEQQNYPRILVSIGSGVSIIKVDSKESFERVAGTMIGGGTLIGLANLLLHTSDFSKIQEMCRKGSNANVDMLVKDLYGSSHDGLEGNAIATSFGKIASFSSDELKNK